MLFLDEEERILDDRECVRVRETITRSETLRERERQTQDVRVRVDYGGESETGGNVG